MAIVTADVVCRHWQPREGILHHADHIQICQRGFHHLHVRAFVHITPSANNAELVGQLDHAITDYEYPPTVWAAGEVVQEQVQISAAKMQARSPSHAPHVLFHRHTHRQNEVVHCSPTANLPGQPRS